MALETGTASDYRDLYRRMVTFLVHNADLVAENQNWEIKRGYIDPDPADYTTYIEGTQYEHAGVRQYDIATAMGWDDTYMAYQEGSERKIGWIARLTDAPNWLGFKKEVAAQPTYYQIQPEYWHGTTDESDRCPKDWIVEYSDNGSTWNTSDIVTGETAWLYTDERTYPITEASPHKYWRINISANNGDATYVTLGRLRFYDASNNWISRGYTTEYMFKAPGWVGPETDPVYCGMRFVIDLQNYYCIEWMGTIGYDEPYGWESQPTETRSKYSPMWEVDMQYWFTGDGAHFLPVWVTGERWIAAYLGKYYPFGAVGQYPYPMIVAGSRHGTISWTATTSLGHIQGLFSDAGAVYRPNNYWSSLSGRNYAGDPNSIGATTTVIAPMLGGGRTAGNRQLPDQAYVLAPYVVEIDNNAYGELIGLKWVSGDNMIPGNILTDENGQEWLVIGNHHLIGINDFAALELK